mmetsp:Transcript_72849/g.138405  ORF Transcript_72849/g.138405 Transcript_72849/m.138405 type:complete len:213 (-) Transcript_72849:281-919(-)
MLPYNSLTFFPSIPRLFSIICRITTEARKLRTKSRSRAQRSGFRDPATVSITMRNCLKNRNSRTIRSMRISRISRRIRAAVRSTADPTNRSRGNSKKDAKTRVLSKIFQANSRLWYEMNHLPVPIMRITNSTAKKHVNITSIKPKTTGVASSVWRIDQSTCTPSKQELKSTAKMLMVSKASEWARGKQQGITGLGWSRFCKCKPSPLLAVMV